MPLRIEFTKTRSPYFARVVSLCRPLPSFKERRSDGLDIFSVEFADNDLAQAQALFEMISKWNGTAFFIDGKLTSRQKAWDRVFWAVVRESEREKRVNDLKAKNTGASADIREASTAEDLVRRQQDRPPEK